MPTLLQVSQFFSLLSKYKYIILVFLEGRGIAGTLLQPHAPTGPPSVAGTVTARIRSSPSDRYSTYVLEHTYHDTYILKLYHDHILKLHHDYNIKLHHDYNLELHHDYKNLYKCINISR